MAKPSTAAPALPTPGNSYVWQNGVLKSSQVYGPSGVSTQSYLTPQEQQVQTLSQQGLADATQQFGQTDLTPDGIQQRLDAYKAPQLQALNESLDQSQAAQAAQAAANGMSDSVGFHNFDANQIARNRAIGSAQISADAEKMRYQLPTMAQQPAQNAAGFYGGLLSGQYNNMSQFNNQASANSQALTQFNMSNYGNAVARANQQRTQNKALYDMMGPLGSAIMGTF